MNDIIACAIQDYYSLLGATGHLPSNEGKNLFIALMMNDYITNYSSFITDEELDCLEKIEKKAIQCSCILSRMVLC